MGFESPAAESRARWADRNRVRCRTSLPAAPVRPPEPERSATRRSRSLPERQPVGAGTSATAAPSTRSRPSISTGGRSLGTALLARSAVAASPELRDTASCVPSAVATTVKGIGASSRRVKVRNDSRMRRMDEESKRWRGCSRKPPTSRARSTTPSTSLRRREVQSRAISAMPGRSGRLGEEGAVDGPD